MRLQIVRVTPEMAAMWLSNGGTNRKLSLHHAKKLATIMADGKWALNGQTISFDDQGRLLDGQHRLTAIVMSGVSVDMVIARDVVDDRAFQTYDAVHLSRGASQIACMMSKNSLKNATKVTSAARALLAWDQAKTYADFIGYFTGNARHYQFPDDVAEKAVQIGDEFNEVFDALGSFVQKGKVRSAWVGVVMILNRIDPVATSSFIEKLRDGLFNDPQDPVRHLREKIMSGSYSSEINSERRYLTNLIHLTVKAWNAHVRGRKIPLLRFSKGQNETIPVPIGSPKK